jgi:hypothetical protein
MGYARIQISPDLIVRALHLPEDTRIVGADMSHSKGAVTLYVAHPLLKNAILEPGEFAALATPRFQTDCIDGQEARVTFLDWGQD